MSSMCVSKDPEMEMWKKVGSPGWTRTSDILINSQALYRLSYRGIEQLRAHTILASCADFVLCAALCPLP